MKIKIPITVTNSFQIDSQGKVTKPEGHAGRDGEPYLDVGKSAVVKRHDADVLKPPTQPTKDLYAKQGNVLIGNRLHYLNRATGQFNYIFPTPEDKWESKKLGGIRTGFSDWQGQGIRNFKVKTTISNHSELHYNVTTSAYEYVNKTDTFDDFLSNTYNLKNDITVPPNTVQCGQLYASKKCSIAGAVCVKTFGKNKTHGKSGNNYTGTWGMDCNADLTISGQKCSNTYSTCKSLLDYLPDPKKMCSKDRRSCQSIASFKPYNDINEFDGWVANNVSGVVNGVKKHVYGSIIRNGDPMGTPTDYAIGWHYTWNDKMYRIYGANTMGVQGPPNPTGSGMYYKIPCTMVYEFDFPIYTKKGKGLNRKYCEVSTYPFVEKYLLGVGGKKDNRTPAYDPSSEDYVTQASNLEWTNRFIQDECKYNAWRKIDTISLTELKTKRFKFNNDFVDDRYGGNLTSTKIQNVTNGARQIYPEVSAEPIFSHVYLCESDTPNKIDMNYNKNAYINNEPYYRKVLNYSLGVSDYNNKYSGRIIKIIDDNIIKNHTRNSRITLYETVDNGTPLPFTINEKIQYTPIPILVEPQTVHSKDNHIFIGSKITYGFGTNYIVSIAKNGTSIPKNHYLKYDYSNVMNDVWIDLSYMDDYMKSEKIEWTYEQIGTYNVVIGDKSYKKPVGRWIPKYSAKWANGLVEDGFMKDDGRYLKYNLLNNLQFTKDRLYYLRVSINGFINNDYNSRAVNYESKKASFEDLFFGLASVRYDENGVGQEVRCTIKDPSPKIYFSGITMTPTLGSTFGTSVLTQSQDLTESVKTFYCKEKYIVNVTDNGISGDVYNGYTDMTEHFMNKYGKIYTEIPDISKIKKGDLIINWQHNIENVYNLVTNSVSLQYSNSNNIMDSSQYLIGDYFIDQYNNKFMLYVWCWEFIRDAYVNPYYRDWMNPDEQYIADAIPVLWVWESMDGIAFTKGRRVQDLNSNSVSCKNNVALCQHWQGSKCILPTQDCHAYKTSGDETTGKTTYQTLNGHPAKYIIEVVPWKSNCNGFGTVKDTRTTVYNKTVTDNGIEFGSYDVTYLYHYYNKGNPFGDNLSKTWMGAYGLINPFAINALVAKKYTPAIKSFGQDLKHDPQSSDKIYTDDFSYTKFDVGKKYNELQIDPTWQKDVYSPQVGKNVVINGKCLLGHDSRYRPWCYNEQCVKDQSFEPRFSAMNFGFDQVFD